MVEAVAVVGLLALGSEAHAQHWGVSAAGGLGTTADRSRTEGGVILPEQLEADKLRSDAYVRTAVGAEYLFRSRRSAHQLTYNFANFVHFGQGRLLSFTNDVLWLGAIQPGRDSELGLTLSGTQGRTGDLYLFGNQRLGDSVARPATSTWFVGAHGGETLNVALGPFWNFAQDLHGDIFQPIGAGLTQARTLGAQAHLGISRRWTNDALGVRVGAGHGRSTEVVNDTVGMIPARKTNFADAMLTLDHAFNDDWDIHLGVGALTVQVPQIRDPFLDGIYSIAASYRTTTGGVVSAQASRGVVTNVFVGDTLLQTGAGVRFTQFFGRNEAWQATGGADFQTGKSVFVIDEKQGGLKVFAVAAGLNYEYSRHIMFDLEASYTYQDAEASRRCIMFLPPYTLHRTMVLASVSYVFPQPELLTGGGGGRRRPRVMGRPAGSVSDVRTGLEAVLDPAAKAERALGEGETRGAGARGRRGDTRTERRDAARGFDPEEAPAQLPPGALPSRERPPDPR
jgi:hypothetical protein